jgi:hypothetical protein
MLTTTLAATLAIATAAATTIAATPVATTTAASSAATPVATATIAAATSAAGGFRAGFIDGEPAAIVVLAVQSFDCRLGFVVIRHFNEPESTAPARLSIAQYLSRAHRAELLEQLLEVFRRGSVSEVTNVKPLGHRTCLKRLSTE